MEIEEKEYERLLRIENREPKLCEGPNCPFWKEADRKKWSWGHFWVGLSKDVKHLIFSPEVWVFAFATVMFWKFGDKKDLGQWISYFALCGGFMFFEPLSNMIHNAKLSIEAKAAANLNKEKKG